MDIQLFPTEIYQQRRKILKEKVGSGRLLFLGNDQSAINYRDNWYPFRQDSTFLYYFGISLPGLAAVIDIDQDREILYGDDPSLDDQVWTGPQESIHSLALKIAVSEVLPSSKLTKYCSQTTKYLPPYRPSHHLKLRNLTKLTIDNVFQNADRPFIRAVIDQRSFKSEEEVTEMLKAADLSNQMHEAVMKTCHSGLFERDLVGVAECFARNSNSRMAYQPILTVNGQILHNHDYHNCLENGQMVLFDGGVETNSGYTSDVTRTFPVGSTFDPLQKDVYELVLKTQQDCVKYCKPSVPFLDIHRKACKELTSGLKDMGFMKGDIEEAVAAGAHAVFFQCGLGHMIGLDVHDMENLGEDLVGYSKDIVRSSQFGIRSLRLARPLEPGFTFTIEPGIYIIPALVEKYEAEKKFSEWVNYSKLKRHLDFGGIRIEDSYLMTASGANLLGCPAAKTIKELEVLRESR